LEKSKRERTAAAKKRGKISSEDSDNHAGILSALMPPPLEVFGQEQDEIWKLQAQVTASNFFFQKFVSENGFCQAIKRDELAIAEEKERLESRRATVS
jgi:hypothetical protein